MEYRCPVCKAPAELGTASFPFCSRRCRLVDLGAWFDGSYRISRRLNVLDVEIEETEEISGIGDLDPGGDALAPGAGEEEGEGMGGLS